MRNIQIPPALTLVIGYDLWLTTYADRALAVYAVYAAAVLTLVRESALDQLLDQGRRRGSQEPLLLLLLALRLALGLALGVIVINDYRCGGVTTAL